MKVRALIADDEPIARLGLREMLADHEWIECAGEAANGPAAAAAIDALRPDLVFLDVQMPGLLGTEVLRRVRHQPFVVFTTAYGQHAVTAFELGALDYLLKPFGPERLAAALARVQAAIGEPLPSPPCGTFQRLQETFGGAPIRRLFARAGAAIVPVAVDDVLWLEAAGDYVAVHAVRGRHLLHVPLHRLEARLDPARFARIHRTSIVNLDRVSAFRRHGKGQLVAVLQDGTRLVVSRSRAKELRSLAT
ncbi:MAG TPA: LytTR family DNA-binding domain-containing protein [Thermoanaerobaculia bacterium]|nr:LytTR family DNA-binding domain-containing protein [Thermoanaerobaculia bacterium]